jgi:hAT family C-terminal dimerisation region
LAHSWHICLFNTWYICLFNSKSSSANGSVSDIRTTSLKDFIHVKKISEPIKFEIKEYLANALDEINLDDDFDILEWWKLNVSKYPVLARLTQDILVISIFTVASESTFSTSSRTLNPVKNSLSDKILRLLYVVRIDCVHQLLVCALIILTLTSSMCSV